MQRMDTQNLAAFVAVAELGSFSLASAQLHLTQPAVSKRVANLEQQLGKPLFDRIGHRIQLTEAGAVLLPQAKAIQDSVRMARRSLHDLDGDVRGPLTLATSHHLGLHRLPTVLRDFAASYPEVALELSFMGSEEAEQAVLTGTVELAITTLAPNAEGIPSSLHSEEVWPDPLAFVVSPTHPLAAEGKTDLATLSQYPAVLPEPDTYTTQIVQSTFKQAGQVLHLRLATNFLETIKMLVSIDFGWSVLPHTLVDKQITTLAIDGVSLTRSLGFIHHRQRSLSNAAKAFIDQLKHS